jgi:hypothetical protein
LGLGYTVRLASVEKSCFRWAKIARGTSNFLLSSNIVREFALHPIIKEKEVNGEYHYLLVLLGLKIVQFSRFFKMFFIRYSILIIEFKHIRSFLRNRVK